MCLSAGFSFTPLLYALPITGMPGRDTWKLPKFGSGGGGGELILSDLYS